MRVVNVMSWIITRQRPEEELQTYVDADIYGRGHWKSQSERTSIFDLPVQYPDRSEAETVIRRYKNADPEFVYHIEYYE